MGPRDKEFGDRGKRMKTTIKAALALALAVVAQAAGAAPLKVVAYEGFLLNYASTAGYFSRAGLEVQVVVSPAATRVLMLGGADAGIAGMSAPVSLYVQGQDSVVLAQLYSAFGFYGVSRYPLTEGYRIKNAASGAKAGEPERRMRAMLKYLGTANAEVDKSFIDENARFKLLEDGRVDLILVNTPALLRKVRAGKKYFIIDPADAYKGKSFNNGLITTGRAMAARGPELEKLVAALLETLDGIAAEPQRFIDFLVNQEGYAPEEAARVQADLARGAAEVAGEPSAADVAAIETDVTVLPGRKVKNAHAAGMMRPDFARKAAKARKARKDAAAGKP